MSQVLSATNFVDSMINDGEWPTPSVLNRPLLACIDADARLEEAVQYAARSMAMVVTDKTRFLSHCIDDGIDTIGNAKPTVTTSVADAFVYDGVFKGSAFVQPATTNILSSIVGLDTTLKTLNGWTSSISSGVSIHVGGHGTTFNNTRFTSVSVGESVVESQLFNVTAGATLSYSVEVSTDTNLSHVGIRIGTSIIYLNSSNIRLANPPTTTCTTNAYKGLLTLENSVVPATATKAVVTCYMLCDANTAIGSVTFKNAMVALSPVAQIHNISTRSATRITYPRVITSNNVGTIMCWANFKSAWLPKHVGPIGPIFMSNSSGTMILGAIHDSSDGASLKIKLRMNVSGVVTFGNTVTLDASNLDKYLPCALRFSKYIDAGVVKMKLEFAIVDEGLTVHTSTIDVPTFDIPAPLDIRVGSDNTTTDYFNGPVSEIRYDEEWINDYELTVIALAKRAFLTAEELTGVTLVKVKEYMDATNANLIRNPDGRLGLNHWTTLSGSTLVGPTLINPTGLSTTVADRELGSAFVWSGAAASDLHFCSPNIAVVPGDQLVFRAKMYANAGTTGEAGIAIGFYDSGTVFTLGQVATVNLGSSSQYYDVPVTIPAGTVYAVAIMYVKNSTTSTRVAWGRLKLEYGDESTLWIDDTTPKYAVYAP